MKVLLINGSPRENGCTYTCLKEIADRLTEHGIQSSIISVGKAVIPGCIACSACRKTGECFRKDLVNEAADLCNEADGFIFGSPVYYAGISGQLKSFMDRLFYSSSSKLAGKPAAAVVCCRRGGGTTAYDDINRFFGINNMPMVSSTYWTVSHGAKPEDVLADKEGVQTLHNLAENMAFLLKALENGKKSGIPLPEITKSVSTNFIR